MDNIFINTVIADLWQEATELACEAATAKAVSAQIHSILEDYKIKHYLKEEDIIIKENWNNKNNPMKVNRPIIQCENADPVEELMKLARKPSAQRTEPSLNSASKATPLSVEDVARTMYTPTDKEIFHFYRRLVEARLLAPKQPYHLDLSFSEKPRHKELKSITEI